MATKKPSNAASPARRGQRTPQSPEQPEEDLVGLPLSVVQAAHDVISAITATKPAITAGEITKVLLGLRSSKSLELTPKGDGAGDESSPS